MIREKARSEGIINPVLLEVKLAENQLTKVTLSAATWYNLDNEDIADVRPESKSNATCVHQSTETGNHHFLSSEQLDSQTLPQPENLIAIQSEKKQLFCTERTFPPVPKDIGFLDPKE